MSTTPQKVTLKFDLPKMKEKIKKIKNEKELFKYAKHLRFYIYLGFITPSPAFMHIFNSQLEKIYKEN